MKEMLKKSMCIGLNNNNKSFVLFYSYHPEEIQAPPFQGPYPGEVDDEESTIVPPPSSCRQRAQNNAASVRHKTKHFIRRGSNNRG